MDNQRRQRRSPNLNLNKSQRRARSRSLNLKEKNQHQRTKQQVEEEETVLSLPAKERLNKSDARIASTSKRRAALVELLHDQLSSIPRRDSSTACRCRSRSSRSNTRSCSGSRAKRRRSLKNNPSLNSLPTSSRPSRTTPTSVSSALRSSHAKTPSGPVCTASPFSTFDVSNSGSFATRTNNARLGSPTSRPNKPWTLFALEDSPSAWRPFLCHPLLHLHLLERDQTHSPTIRSSGTAQLAEMSARGLPLRAASVASRGKWTSSPRAMICPTLVVNSA